MVSDTFNPECPNCKITIGRIEKWIDHVNITPKKYQRYDSLLIFVRRIADDKYKNVSSSRIARCAQDLLEEIGEND